MSGENIVVWGATTKVLESAGALVANNALVMAAGTYSVETDGGGFPDVDAVLTVTYSTAPTEAAMLVLVARPIDVDGTLDTEVPEIARPTLVLGSFQVNNVTTPQTLVPNGLGYIRELPRKAEYYLWNNATGQAVQAGWSLKFTPRSYKAAP